MMSDVLNVRISGEFERWLDEMRRKEPDIPTRSEMARRAIRFMAASRGLTQEDTHGQRKAASRREAPKRRATS